MENVLVVEDTPSLRGVLTTILENEGYQVAQCDSAEAAVDKLENDSFSLILSDFKLPGMSGLELLSHSKNVSPKVPFLVMTAFGSIDLAVEAIKAGATDFVSKPFESDQICSVIKSAIQKQNMKMQKANLQTKRKRKLVTKDQNLQQIITNAKRAAKFDSTVLVLGESGTGKELLARHIHMHSERADQPFLSVNCAAMSAELLESEFFGHEAGAFTGASSQHKGLFEAAKDGTIFLDEIGEMPPQLQVKLLRALQEKEIKRVGGTKVIKVNPRVIAATNRKIDESIKSGRIREDLYYRLAVLSFTLPPLRERKDDISILMDYFATYFAELYESPVLPVSKEAQQVCRDYPWPGNIRELENSMERAYVLAKKEILPQHLGISLPEHEDGKPMTLPKLVETATRRVEVLAIKEALHKANGNKAEASRTLGVSYKTLLNKIKDYEI